MTSNPSLTAEAVEAMARAVYPEGWTKESDTLVAGGKLNMTPRDAAGQRKSVIRRRKRSFVLSTAALTALLALLQERGWLLTNIAAIRALIQSANHCDATICKDINSDHCICEVELREWLAAAPAPFREEGGDGG